MPNPSADTVPLDSITTTPVTTPIESSPLPANVDPLTGQRDGRLDQHLGRVGRHIGGGPEKAGNIAYIVIIAALVLLIVGACVSAYASTDKLTAVYDRVVTGAFSLITGALGFLFGKSGASKD